MRMWDLHVQSMHGYINPGIRICTILMTKFASRALNAVTRVHVQNEYLYFVHTIPAELQMVRLAADLEHGRVYANVGGITISDPDCYVTVCVMF